MSDPMTWAQAPWGIGWGLMGNDPTGDSAGTAPTALPLGTGRLPLARRVGAALQGVGSALQAPTNPDVSPLASGLGGLSSGFVGTQQATDYARAQPVLAAQDAQDRAARLRLQGSEADAYNALTQQRIADANAPAPAVPDRWTFVNDPGVAPYRLNLTTGERQPVVGAPTRPVAADAPLTPHQVATERRGVRSDRAKQASDLRLHADDVLNSPNYKGLGLSDLTTAADSSAYTDATQMRQHADWLVTHPLTVPQVDSVRAGTLDYDNYPGVGAQLLRGGTTAGNPPLSDAQTARAAADPQYRAFLQSKGYVF